MTSKRQPLGDRPQRVAKRKSREFTLNMEYLEDRYAPVSDILPATDLAGPNFTGNVPPQPEGAVGADYLVSVVNNNIHWRLKDGTGTPVEVSINNLFNNTPTDINGNQIVDSNGNPLAAFDPGPIGVNFANNTNQPFTINAVNVGPAGGYTSPMGTNFGAGGARILYDQYMGRFVVKAEGNNNDNLSYIWVAVSVSENPNDGWFLLSMLSSSSYDPDGLGVGQGFLDSTVRSVQMGLTRDAVVFAGNVHLEQSGAAFDSRIFIVDKQFFYEGGGTTAIRMGANLQNWYDGTSGSRHRNLMPTHNYDADENSAFFIEAAPNQVFLAPGVPGVPIPSSPNNATFFRVDNAPFFAQIVRNDPVFVGGQLSPGFGFPGLAVARGDVTGPVFIDPNTQGSSIPGGTIFTSAVYRPDQANPTGGVGSLWTAHTLNRDTDGDSIPDRPTVRWYEFTVRTPTADPNFNITPTVRQQGGVDADNADQRTDPGNQFVLDTYSPAIVVNSLNDMAISFAGSNEVTFISAFYAGRFERDFGLGQFAGTTRPARLLREGEAFYNRQSAFNVPPWGPFSGIGLDPTNDDRFWAFNAYAATPDAVSGLIGSWATTWGAFELVADTLVFVVDVSLSMEYIHSIDVNGDGVVDSTDDRNGDGLDGSVLDQAIFEIEKLFEQGLLPSQQGQPGNVGLIIFGRDAKPVEIDLTGAQGSTLVGNAEADNNGNGIPDFLEAVRSIDVGEAGVVSLSAVDPTRTFYNSALAALTDVNFGVTKAQMYSNGSGRLPDPNNPNIPAGVRVDTIVLGPYQLVGDVTPFTNIADATLSRIIRINNDRGVTSDFVPVGPSPISRLQRPGSFLITPDGIITDGDESAAELPDPETEVETDPELDPETDLETDPENELDPEAELEALAAAVGGSNRDHRSQGAGDDVSVDTLDAFFENDVLL